MLRPFCLVVECLLVWFARKPNVAKKWHFDTTLAMVNGFSWVVKERHCPPVVS